ncbi:lysophospholipid acyltransferase family protein [Haloechinothrix sp. LS1_15]|uniref:lysophospholipid acyltransferase family protein n=1 Tax=Haloechinothrix sp. LS1_15 TaxID=2652248 RepID=UPI00294570C9|nr:lysophospholipid acyltransferase family protein [Haloechinothrix sp. LS1_15]MDV6012159.1 1-acyl-sn-glycerol-3-phosphate acyltransferase [Haloechinothrix sp. LS1_15]
MAASTVTPAIWRSLLAADTAMVRLAGDLVVTGSVPERARQRPLLLAANHIGVFDPMVLMAACRQLGLAPRFMLAGGLLDAPVLGKALRSSGHLRVDRGKGSVLEQFTRAAEQVRPDAPPLLVYPEGRISRDPGLWPERGKTGAARLALASGATVIPISQWGAHEAVYWGTETVSGLADIVPLARSGLTSPLRRPTFRVHFGTPVDLSDVEPDRPGAGMRAHRRIMQRIVDGLVPLRYAEPDRPRFVDPTRPTDGSSPWKPGITPR